MEEVKVNSIDEEIEIPTRMISPNAREGDGFQVSLRPSSLSEYIGQERLKDHVSLAINATIRRGEALDHVLLHGPPGLGKTTLAAVIATELGVSFKATSGPILERPGDLAAILSSLNEKDVLFIDEIHRMPRIVEEILYPAMEDFEIDILIGQGSAARSVKVEIKPFTLVAATTRVASLTAPLRDRFGIIERFDFYTEEELARIVTRSSALIGISIDGVGAEEIASRARGTPRIANRLLKRSRDFAQERADGKITAEVASHALAVLAIDHCGLDRMDRLLLRTLSEVFDGGPVGIESLAAALQEERSTLEDVYEPFLLSQGFLRRTPRGRELSEKGRAHLEKVSVEFPD